ncbi:hypothetical protein DH2020_034780 [Rehmannia glutinosa]|uniref:Phytocyanin domain-containing protein n=1 Tax=Rehmannia glutinosa TaxID=99300 RepID=A0ABR0VBR5_REHGL
MGFSSMLALFFSLVTPLLFQLSQSATFVVDGVSEWKNPHVQIGDSVIFQHKYHYSLYIFQNKNAFTLCNFTQATILTKPNSSSYTKARSSPWRSPLPRPQIRPPPLRCHHQYHRRLLALAALWRLLRRSLGRFSPESASPSPAPGLSLTAGGPMAPDKEGIPFINSNPAVPLPTGEVDSATIRGGVLWSSDRFELFNVGNNDGVEKEKF